jgi:hypothetical protein
MPATDSILSSCTAGEATITLPALMRSLLWKCVAIFSGASLIVICSCEKHSVGEMPEAQKEHVDLGEKPAEHSPSAEPNDSPAASASPTPAEFFPEKKSP